MRQRVLVWKKVGETPLAALQKWQRAHPSCAHLPASYAGRLDPMAEGLLLLLLGDECKNQAQYRSLDKEYEIEIVLDLSTDTGDVLGLPSYGNIISLPSSDELHEVLRAEVGTKTIPYPAFSSKTVDGKPLFLYALEGTLNTISIPTHVESIHGIRLLKERIVSARALKKRIDELLQKAPRTQDTRKELGADFRQDEIREAWDTLFHALPNRSFHILTLRVRCASGTYMRSLAERIGAALSTTAFAVSITRTRIGPYRRPWF